MNTQAIKVVEIENIRHLKDVLRLEEFDLAVGINAVLGITPATGVTIWFRTRPELHTPLQKFTPKPELVNTHPVRGYSQFTIAQPDTYPETLVVLREQIFTSFTVANYGGSGTYI